MAIFNLFSKPKNVAPVNKAHAKIAELNKQRNTQLNAFAVEMAKVWKMFDRYENNHIANQSENTNEVYCTLIHTVNRAKSSVYEAEKAVLAMVSEDLTNIGTRLVADIENFKLAIVSIKRVNDNFEKVSYNALSGIHGPHPSEEDLNTVAEMIELVEFMKTHNTIESYIGVM